ncbi:hypothetical protein HY448_02270 [Candidatus Pacearchaeota archaeon]|nr:hypothetical protein [Candidatus Pacearchaeota archaeon]
MVKRLYYSIAILMGTIIGAGFLGIPYVVMKSGFLIGLIEMIFISTALCFFMIYLGKLVIRTKGNHQLAGYAEIYIGKKGKWIMFLAFVFSMYATILAYLVGEGQSLSFLFYNNLSYELYFGIFVWFFLSLLTYYGLKALQKEELLGIGLVMILVLSIIVFYGWRIDFQNLSTFYLDSLFTPIGVILFAFLGFSSVPLLKRITKDDGKIMTRSIIISHVVVFILYLVFTVIVLGYSGDKTPEVATIALGKVFVLLGIMTMFNSYFGSSIILRDTWEFDWKISKNLAWFLTIVPPLILFLFVHYYEFNSFTKIINVGAWISGVFTGVLLLCIFFKSRKILFRKTK